MKLKDKSVGGLLEAIRNGTGRSKFKLTRNGLDAPTDTQTVAVGKADREQRPAFVI